MKSSRRLYRLEAALAAWSVEHDKAIDALLVWDIPGHDAKLVKANLLLSPLLRALENLSNSF